MTTESWFETEPAAKAVGCSISSLRRYRDSHGGFLVAGLHYRPGGPSHNSRIFWNVPLIQKEFLRRNQIKMISEFSGSRRPTPDRPTSLSSADLDDDKPRVSITDEEIFGITKVILEGGSAGNFERSLAHAIRCADPLNKRLLLETFPRLVEKFHPTYGYLR